MFEVPQTRHFAEWFAQLRDERARARIEVRIRCLSLGNAGDAKPIGDGVSELRIDYRPGYRVYYTQKGRELLLLLCGGAKATQDKDIARAKALASEWKD